MSKLTVTTTTTAIGNRTQEGIPAEVLIKKLGGAYVPGRDVAEIAKEVRSLIRKAVKAGYLPQLKASVRIDRYSMGCSLTVEVTEIAETVINIDAWRAQAASGYMLSWVDYGGRYNARGQQVLAFLGLIVAAFQKSETHHQSDYHNTNFHGDVRFAHQVEQRQLAGLGEAC